MKKKDEYLRHAAECRALAKQMEQGEHRDQLLKMAETWEVLAEERARTRRSGGDDDQDAAEDSPAGLLAPDRKSAPR